MGDIVYWTGSEKKTISRDRWISTLGKPIGVVTIPDGFAPDGKARMVSLSGVTSDGVPDSSDNTMAWSKTNKDTTLINYTKVPTTDNEGSTSTGSNPDGYLPSDNFLIYQSFVDPIAYYASNSLSIPSPYKIVDDITYPNPEYYKEISGNNALSDFSGRTNTDVLVGLGTGYTAANACWTYNDGISGTQWYLPACGELGYMMPRFNEINKGLAAVSAVQLDSSGFYWSSSEYSSIYAYSVYTKNGDVSYSSKPYGNYARPWALVE